MQRCAGLSQRLTISKAATVGAQKVQDHVKCMCFKSNRKGHWPFPKMQLWVSPFYLFQDAWPYFTSSPLALQIELCLGLSDAVDK